MVFVVRGLHGAAWLLVRVVPVGPGSNDHVLSLDMNIVTWGPVVIPVGVGVALIWFAGSLTRLLSQLRSLEQERG